MPSESGFPRGLKVGGDSVADTFVHDSSGARRVSYSIDERPGCVLVTVAGQIDHENCPGVCDAVCVAGEFATSVVVELSDAHFGDDAAVGLLLDTLRATAEGNRVAVVAAPTFLAEQLPSGIETEARVRDRVAEAERVPMPAPEAVTEAVIDSGSAEGAPEDLGFPVGSPGATTQTDEVGPASCPDCGGALRMTIPGFRPIRDAERDRLTPDAVRVLGLCPSCL